MTGLDKIIEQIREEARISSEQAIAKTKEEVEGILAEGLQDREAFKTAFLAQTDTQVELLLSRGEAAAALQKRKILLKEKQQMIRRIMEKAKESILNLPENEYFELLLKMIDRYAKDGKCSILLSKRDRERAPENFLQELNNRSMILSGESDKIDGGFILVYGDIEENCSLEALFAVSKEVLQDKISALIFTNSGAEMER